MAIAQALLEDLSDNWWVIPRARRAFHPPVPAYDPRS